ncbi:unnamed protein product [Ilex paraguariensis]|uniref:Uncharacterized protein n=1 Tax=Ilex paraguariensis TaxID=185542 RepID=A0ABC8TA37_9AQUA
MFQRQILCSSFTVDNKGFSLHRSLSLDNKDAGEREKDVVYGGIKRGVRERSGVWRRNRHLVTDSYCVGEVNMLQRSIEFSNQTPFGKIMSYCVYVPSCVCHPPVKVARHEDFQIADYSVNGLSDALRVSFNCHVGDANRFIGSAQPQRINAKKTIE